MEEVVDDWTGRHACALQCALRMSQEAFAERLGVSRRAVTTWHERPDSVIRPELQQALDTLFENASTSAKLRFSRRLHRAAEPAPAKPTKPVSTPRASVVVPTVERHAPVEFNDPDEYLQSIRANVSKFVSLDNSFGGADLLQLSTRYFAGLHAHLGSADYKPGMMRELYAAAGELAEVVGWLAYDADQHDLTRRMNQESLHYTRLAGDKSMELLTLQNMSMHAAARGRTSEAVQIVRSVLEGDYRLTSRLKALFLMRQARVLAQRGDESALPLMSEVQARYEDGLSDRDPAWSWWVDQRELDWHEAMILRDLRMTDRALSKFEMSAARVPAAEMRSQYVHRAHLFQAQVESGTWRDAEKTIEQVLSLSVEVASTRTTVLLHDLLTNDEQLDKAPKSFLDQAHRALATINLASVRSAGANGQ